MHPTERVVEDSLEVHSAELSLPEARAGTWRVMVHTFSPVQDEDEIGVLFPRGEGAVARELAECVKLC